MNDTFMQSLRDYFVERLKTADDAEHAHIAIIQDLLEFDISSGTRDENLKKLREIKSKIKAYSLKYKKQKQTKTVTKYP